MREFRTPQDRHESAVGVRYNETSRRWDGSLVDTKPLYGPHLVADNEYEALMQCPPRVEPIPCLADVVDGAVMIEHFLSVLAPKERSVIELVVFGQMSLSQAGTVLAREYGRNRAYSKTMVVKLRDSALQKMRSM